MRVFFLGLSELRAIAAFAVVISHIELFKKRENIPSLYDTWLTDFISMLGKNGVYLFFVLSGFLITYLLLAEGDKIGKIDIRKFYIRRILRIWPLYYAVVLFCLLILPLMTSHFSEFFETNYYIDLLNRNDFSITARFIIFMLFLPNIALILFPPVAAASQSWSVGVEEQFYLIWPILLNRFRNNILLVLILVIASKAILFALVFILIKLYDHRFLKYTMSFLTSFNIELMSFGGIGAVALKYGYFRNFLAKIRKWHVWLLVVGIVLLMLAGVNYLIISLLFLMLIIFNTEKSSNITTNRSLSFLGDISYGIYMYHPLMMFFSFVLTMYLFGNQSSLVFNLSFYVMTVALTVIISLLSYKYFESLFLKLKDKYTVVQSGKG